jgi:hypothetical protein
MKPFRLAAFAVAILLAACTTSPTDPARLDSTAPSFDGGGSLGSGNNSEDGSNGMGSGNNTDDGLSDGESTVPVDTLNRGPGMLGSGN